MLKTPPKLVLTARVEPELKEQLSAEAVQCEMNLSSYTEYCLRHFNSVLYARQVSEERNETLTERITTLAYKSHERLTEIERLTEQNEEQKTENQSLSGQLTLHKKQVESLEEQVTNWQSAHSELAEQIRNLKEFVSECTELNLSSDAENERLTIQVIALQSQIQQLKAEKTALSNSLVETIEDRDTRNIILKSRLPIALSPATIEHTTKLLADLQQHHLDYSLADLLVWALATAARNEKHTYTMYNLMDFKKRNPDFFTLKQIKK